MSTPQPPVNDPYGQGPQDPYGQGPYEQAPQPPYGQNPYGQAPYGQAAQDPYAQNPYGPGTGLQAGRPRPSVSFGQAISLFFKNYAVFNGRASRSEFWWSLVFMYLVNIILSGLSRAIGDTGSTVLAFVSLAWSLAIIVPTLAICWRRLHDTGRSGGWYFINLIPIVGQIIFIVFAAGQSKPDAWQRFDNGKLPVES